MFVIFDLDGTLADLKHRLHLVTGPGKHDWDLFYDLCMEDAPIQPVVEMCRSLLWRGFRVEVWSGRRERCRDMTTAWLEARDIYPHALLMRSEAENDLRDDLLKRCWLKSCDRAPDLVFDDRQRVVSMWRREGIRVAQVAEGNY